MVLQGDRISHDFVDEWVEVGYSFLNDKEIPSRRGSSKAAGSYRYKSPHILCKDRWIIWRAKDDVVELSELSLHTTLTNNGLRLVFPNTSVISPITIVEEGFSITILICTTASVHRIICPHPACQQTEFAMGSAPSNTTSIFTSIDTSVLQTKHHFSYIPHDVAPSLATAALSQVGAAVFAFSYPSSDLRLVTLPPIGVDAGVTQTDLHQWSVMQRLWSGVSRRSVMTESVSSPLSVAMSQIGPDMLLFTLCKDIRLRVWSVSSKECINIESVTCDQLLKTDDTQMLTFKAATANSTAMLGMHLSFTDGSIFRVYSVLYTEGQLNMTPLVDHTGWEVPLQHFSLTSDKILALYNEKGMPRILTLEFESGEGAWYEAQLLELPELDEAIFDDPTDFVDFCRIEFTEHTICTSLGKMGYDIEESSVEEALNGFVRTHRAMGDLDEVLPKLYEECSIYHVVHSVPMAISDGMLVMDGDVALLRPNRSDYYVSGNTTLAETLMKLNDFIPAENWALLQDINTGNTCLTDIAKGLITRKILPEQSAQLDALILSIANISQALSDAVASILTSSPSACQLPVLFRSLTGNECLIRAVDEGVYDAHKSYALLLVCLVYIEQEGAEVGEATQALIRTRLIPECVQIMEQFSLLIWVSTQVINNQNSATDLENFDALNIKDADNKPRTILHHYLASRQPQIEYSCLEDLNTIVTSIINVMYPGSVLLDLPLFLLSSQYYTQLQEYYERCCDQTPALEHIVAQAYAATDDAATAVKMFISVAGRVDLSSPILSQFIGTQKDNMSLSLQYIIKCITMLERTGLQKAIITLANQATQFSEKEHLPLLYSLAFKHAVEMGQYDAAYKAMSLNPCPSQKHACLKRFVVVLVESGNAKRLVNYPYHGFKAEIVNVLEFKARNSDLRLPQNKNYYNLVFAFHVKNKMYQHAAAAAYEHVLRLQSELPGVQSLQQQLHGYLAAISCLELLTEQDAWILEPTQYADIRVSVNASPKRSRHGEQNVKKMRAKLALITVKELRLGYLMVDSLIKVGATKPDSIKLHNLSPSEVLGLLCSCGLYDQAFLLAKYHDLAPPLASLTSRCINIAQHFAAHQHVSPGVIEWLNLNNIPKSDQLNPAERSWLYLQSMIDQHAQGSWDALKSVLTQMLSAPYSPPFWLLKLCKACNVESTIRLCVQYDNLHLAVNLAIGYIGAVAGRETLEYGLEHSLHSNMPPVYVPYTVLDQVLLQLKQRKDKTSTELYQDLLDNINTHFDLLDRVSADHAYLSRMVTAQS